MSAILRLRLCSSLVAIPTKFNTPRVDGGKARIIDLPHRMVTIPFAELLAEWDGTAIEISQQPITDNIMAASRGQMITMGMPIVQLVLALCFLTRTFLDAAHLATLFFLTCFATVQTSARLRGLDISCGCFVPGHDSPIGWFSLSLVYGLLILSLLRNGIFLLHAQAKDRR